MNYSHTIIHDVLGAAQNYPVTISFTRVDHVFSVALGRAERGGLGIDLAEDTSQNFGVRWLSALRENKRWAKRCLESEAYLSACAENYRKHAALDAQTLRYRESSLSKQQENGKSTAQETRDLGQYRVADPAIRAELQGLLSEAVGRLAPRPREIFTRRHLHQESSSEIAEALGCTPNAVSVSLSASKQQIEKHLASAGHSEEDIREYLYEMLRPD